MARKPKTEKVITRRKKFIKVELPLIKSRIELIGNSPEELKNKTIKLDLTRQLKGKSVEATVKILLKDEKLIAQPIKINLMPYFIRRMIRKRISYVEDSFETPSQQSMIRVKPFLITRKRVSRVVRKTLRNKARNWIEDYIAERKDSEIFNEILSNKMQKPLSLSLKKTYPLSLCEIRVLEIKRPLESKEIPKIKKKPKQLIENQFEQETEQGIDQLAEIEEEKKKKAEQEIEQTQKKALEKQEIGQTETKQELKEALEEAKRKIKAKKKEKEQEEKTIEEKEKK